MATKKITLNELKNIIKKIIKEENYKLYKPTHSATPNVNIIKENSAINMEKHVWEGWTVGDFIDELEPMFDMIMNRNSWQKPFKTKDEIKKWCMDNQPYYKKYVKDVVDYFVRKAGI